MLQISNLKNGERKDTVEDGKEVKEKLPRVCLPPEEPYKAPKDAKRAFNHKPYTVLDYAIEMGIIKRTEEKMDE